MASSLRSRAAGERAIIRRVGVLQMFQDKKVVSLQLRVLGKKACRKNDRWQRKRVRSEIGQRDGGSPSAISAVSGLKRSNGSIDELPWKARNPLRSLKALNIERWPSSREKNQRTGF